MANTRASVFGETSDLDLSGFRPKAKAETTRGKVKRADYILYYKPNTPIAIVEPKDNTHSVGDGMQQALDYATTLNIPFVFSSNGDGFVFHDRTGASKEKEASLSLDQFPSPQQLWSKMLRMEGTHFQRGRDRPAGLFRRRQRQSAPQLSDKCDQCDDGSDCQGPEPDSARDGHRHRQTYTAFQVI
jgi:hypothetical protein